MKRISLTQGKVALVDDEDFEIVNLFKWYATRKRNIFYATTNIKINGQHVISQMHRLILNSKPHEITDHKDMNGLNNTRNNLRKCSCSQNHMNRKSYRGSFSKYKGVGWHEPTKKWQARISINYKVISLGYFKNEMEAALAYNKKAIELFGEFANFNIVRFSDKKCHFTLHMQGQCDKDCPYCEKEAEMPLK